MIYYGLMLYIFLFSVYFVLYISLGLTASQLVKDNNRIFFKDKIYILLDYIVTVWHLRYQLDLYDYISKILLNILCTVSQCIHYEQFLFFILVVYFTHDYDISNNVKDGPCTRLHFA